MKYKFFFSFVGTVEEDSRLFQSFGNCIRLFNRPKLNEKSLAMIQKEIEIESKYKEVVILNYQRM